MFGVESELARPPTPPRAEPIEYDRHVDR